jgi:hypothetical protein
MKSSKPNSDEGVLKTSDHDDLLAQIAIELSRLQNPCLALAQLVDHLVDYPEENPVDQMTLLYGTAYLLALLARSTGGSYE